MAALRGDSRWLVFLARGCDTFQVGLCPALLGRELFDGLRRAGDAARGLLTQVGFPVPISNRIAYGMAAGTWGGRDADHVKPYSLTAADFPKTSEETFDNWFPPTDTKLEPRPAKPSTLSDWRRHTTNEILAWGLIYGAEHRRERELARDRLEQCHDRDPHQYPFHWLTATWEELWWRWWEELKETLRVMQVDIGTGAMTKDLLKHFALSPRGAGLGPRLRLPTTFQLDDPQAYYACVIRPRIDRGMSRHLWSTAWKTIKPPPPRTRKAGGGAEKGGSPGTEGPGTGGDPGGHPDSPDGRAGAGGPGGAQKPGATGQTKTGFRLR